MNTINRVTSAGLVLFGCLVIISGLSLGLSLKGVPGPGFLPFWTGIFLTILSGLELLKTFTKSATKEPSPIIKEEFKNFLIIILSSCLAILITQYIGLLLTLGIMSAAISRFLGTKKNSTTAAVLIITPVVLYAIFKLGLNVPLPKGIFGF